MFDNWQEFAALHTRLTGRKNQNRRTAKQTGSVTAAARADAYETALRDLEELMTDKEEESRLILHEHEIHKLRNKITMLEDQITQLGRRERIGQAAYEALSGFKMRSISPNIVAPIKEGDVGYNLVSDENVTIPIGTVVNVHTGVKIKLPEGYWGYVTARSSAVFKYHILVLQGVIDTGYTGELMVACTALTKQVILPKGTSIAQLVLFPSVTPEIEIVDKLPETQRGESGFGSTDENVR